jgi:hypothetical protein
MLPALLRFSKALCRVQRLLRGLASCPGVEITFLVLYFVIGERRFSDFTVYTYWNLDSGTASA